MNAAIVIVTYNSGDEIEACLAACRPYASTISVVDNASTDQSPNFATILNSQNLGFAAAVKRDKPSRTFRMGLILPFGWRFGAGLIDWRKEHIQRDRGTHP